jgi:hypothetical protein
MPAVFAHRRVTVDVHGPADTIISIPDLYCPDDFRGEALVKKAVREEAEKRGIRLGAWDYLRHDRELEWDGRVYGEKVVPA